MQYKSQSIFTYILLLFLQHSLGCIAVYISEMRKQTQRGWVIFQSHTADKWQSQDSNSGLSIRSPTFFPLYHTTGYIFVPAFCGALEGLLEMKEDEIEFGKSLSLPQARSRKMRVASMFLPHPKYLAHTRLHDTHIPASRGRFTTKLKLWAPPLCRPFQSPWVMGAIHCLHRNTLKYPELISKRQLIEFFQIWQQPWKSAWHCE